ncbi:hypothetical protein Tco_0277521 [Tanacetum coccineum]
MHQPWRTFVAIINKCISGKTTEDFMYQADNREISSARKEHMPYPRFTKVIIDHFISKNKTISMRNRINLHIARDDSLLGTLKFVSKTDDAQKPAKKSTTTPTAGVVIRDTPGVSVSKKKAPTKGDRGKGIELLSDATLLEAAQVKEALKKSKLETQKVQVNGLSEGVGSQPKVHDESEDKTAGTDEGTGAKLGVPDVPTYESESENESWGDSQDDERNNDDDDNDSDNKDGKSKDDDGNSDADDNERTDLDDDDENPSFTLKDYDEEEHDEEYESDDDYENVYEKEDDDLYKDVDVRSLGAEHKKERKGDTEMTDADQNLSQEKSFEQVVEDAHVTLTSS